MSERVKSDEELVSELGAGHSEAMALLVQRHQHKAMATAYRLLENWETAEDITQAVFLCIHKAASQFQARAKFTVWFYRILRNLCVDELRRRERQARVCRAVLKEPPRPETADNPVYAQAIAERQLAVRRALATLRERERTAVVLHRFEGLRHKDIAEIYECSEAAVESLLVRTYRKLRQELSDFSNP